MKTNYSFLDRLKDLVMEVDAHMPNEDFSSALEAMELSVMEFELNDKTDWQDIRIDNTTKALVDSKGETIVVYIKDNT